MLRTMTSANRRRSTRWRPIRWSVCAARTFSIRRACCSAQVLSNPAVAAQQYLALLGELGRIATGASELAPDAKDKRFADPAWKESFAYRALAQAYLAWGDALNRFRRRSQDGQARCRARALRRLAARGRDGADQLARRQSRGAEEARRHRRREPRARAGEFRRRPRAQRRPAGAGRHAEVRRRQESRDHAGLGRVPQPGDGADPVPADGERGARAAAAHRPAADQQVLRLRSRAREEHHPAIASRAACRPSPSAGRTRRPPKATSGSTPTSRRWRKPST